MGIVGRILSVIALACLSSPAFAQDAPPPASAYGRLPSIADAALSPDGARVALAVGMAYDSTQPDRDLTAFRVVNIDTGQVEHTLAPPERNTLRGVGWADARRPYYHISMTARPSEMMPEHFRSSVRGQRIEFFRLGVFSLDTGRSALLMAQDNVWGNTALTQLTAPVEGDPGFGRMVAWGGLGVQAALPRLSVFRVDLDSGFARPSFVGEVNTRGILLNQRGDVAARVDINENSDRWRLFAYQNGQARQIMEDVSEMGRPLNLYGILPDGRFAVVNPHENGERDTMLAVDPVTGASEPLGDANGSDVGAVHDPWTHHIVGLRWIEDLPKQRFLDEQLQSILTAVQPRFEDGYVIVESWSQDRARVLLFGERAGDAGGYYIYEPEGDRLRSVGFAYPELTELADLGERRSINYRARDGTRIPAYLTLPSGVEASSLPLVLLVHGGPHARDTFAFDWWASFLASRGYAVLQPNFRGSTGYGYEWFDAGRGGWGSGVMQTDVEDGVAALVRIGVADPARICIMGASYGGYAALAGATLTPERYACAVSVNGLSDPIRLLNEAESGQYGRRGMSAEWWRRSMGDDMASLRAATPIDHANDVRVPVLLIHGDEDSVVPIQQSRTMASRLENAGKDVRFVELEGDDHWLSSASTRTRMLEEIERFLAEHLAADAP